MADSQAVEPANGATVLGIDAAWTTTQPSGVALVVRDRNRWICCGLAPSYQQFCELSIGRQVDWTRSPPPGRADVNALLVAAHALAGQNPDAIAVDMPLAFEPITARRTSDTAISRLFGAAGAAVHLPSAIRPGPIAEEFRVGLERRGYELTVRTAHPAHQPALIETYPHPIAMWLCNSCRRLPYKTAKSGIYWPGQPLTERRRRLLTVWKEIVFAVEGMIDGINLPQITPALIGSRSALKAFEDALDALICAIAGISYLLGTAIPYGDDASAIWLPMGCESYALRPDNYKDLTERLAQGTDIFRVTAA